jgi:membrane protein YqaA with SNARE-associated domain
MRNDPANPPADAPVVASAAASARPPVSRWAIHRRLYDWVLSFAHHRHSTMALFLLSFSESSFFPIPPDVLQIALTLERPKRAWWYAAVSTIGSVLGGAAGYLIGWGGWHLVSEFFFRWIPGFTPEVFENVQNLYREHDVLIVFAAAFTPIPYKVFTITGGVVAISIPMFLLASAIGRGARFFIVAGLLAWFGPSIKTFIDRYFNLLCIVFTVLLVGGIFIIKYFK